MISNASHLKQMIRSRKTNKESRNRPRNRAKGAAEKPGRQSSPAKRVKRHQETAIPYRDIFLSHRSTNKEFVHKLAGDIELETFQSRRLTTWVDEAEISPGQSVPGMVNQGLENSRFIGLVMTPDYFQSKSGWTDAEWHSALHTDPDNRRARIIPLLVTDCPYIPFLIRHLRAIDFRGRYAQGLQELLAVLKDEPLPRPVTYRGQLVAPGGKVSRETLLTERSVPQADPDVVSERLYCNLLPLETLPKYVYSAPIVDHLCGRRKDDSKILPSKQELKDLIREAQIEARAEKTFVPAFRTVEDSIITFHDLESPQGPLTSIIDDERVDQIPVKEFLREEDDRKLLISLLNMSLSRHANRAGLVADDTKLGRFFFPPKDGGPRIITWSPRKKKATRTVAKPCLKDGRVAFWRHLGAYLRVVFLANKFYLQITPTWVITEDGFRVSGGPKVGQLIIKWTGPERNLQVLFHIRFWTTVLRRSSGPIAIRAGDQIIEIATVPAFVQQAYGIAQDQKDLMRLLDQEAPLIAELEDERADQATEEELSGELTVEEEEDELADVDLEEESEFGTE
jgi:hypothetical protein